MPITTQYTTDLAAEIRYELKHLPDNWRGSTVGERWLEKRIAAAERVAKKEPDQRIALHTTAIRAVLSIYAELWDTESEIAGVVAQSLRTLASLLPAPQALEPQAHAQRQAILRELLDTALWDVFSGGYGLDMAPEELLLAAATDVERQELAEVVRAEIAKHCGPKEHRSRQNAGRLALRLVNPTTASPEHLRWLAEAGLSAELAKHMLAKGDLAGAVAVLDCAHGADLDDLVGIFARAGQLALAAQAVLRHPALPDPECEVRLGRLAELGVAVPAALQSLRWALESLRQRPNLRDWAAIRTTATELGRWPQVLDLVRLRPDRTSDIPLVARWHAARGEAEAALTALAQLSGSPWNSAALAVADDLAGSHPVAAASVFRQLLTAAEARKTKPGRELAAAVRERLQKLGDARGPLGTP